MGPFSVSDGELIVSEIILPDISIYVRRVVFFILNSVKLKGIVQSGEEDVQRRRYYFLQVPERRLW